MNGSSSAKFHKLADLNIAIRKEIDALFPDHFEPLGEMPVDWPETGTPDHIEKIAKIKAGLAFQCMEDFLWPKGHQAYTATPLFVGRFPPSLLALDGNNGPSPSDVLWSSHRLELQPVAMRSYRDCERYAALGRRLETVFPLVAASTGDGPRYTSNCWTVRRLPLGVVKVSRSFRHNMRGCWLYYQGKYPSKVAEQMLPEIKFVLGNGRDASDLGRYGLHAPPDKKFEHAFCRQVAALSAKWEETNLKKSEFPGVNWVLDTLTDWLPGESGLERFINDDCAKNYRKALIEQLDRSI